MNTPIVEISRTHRNGILQVLGNCVIYDAEFVPIFSSLSMERGDNNNIPNKSCVLPGSYDLVLEWSHKYECDLWELKGTEGRSEAKFHSASFWYDLQGCVSLGQWRTDMNNDGFYDLACSRSTMRSFHKALNGYKKVKLIIQECYT